MRHLLCLLLAYAVLSTVTAAPIKGHFTATQSCPLYQSKNKQTNPDDLYSQVQQTFTITEYLGQVEQPEWFRVITQATLSPPRWINASCGTFTLASVTTTPPIHNNSNSTNQQCDIAQQFDGHVLALSWQSAFCELSGGKRPECKTLSTRPSDPRWQSFSLHGLWPNQQNCGKQYGFCSSVKQASKHFCDYPAITLNKNIKTQLDNVMPSAEAGSCLERHQWWKHGTCRDLDPNHYYLLAARLTKQFNESQFVQAFVKQHIGKKVSRQQMNNAFDTSFGQLSFYHLKLQCKQGLLTEIQLQLPAEINGDTSLAQLISQNNDAVNHINAENDRPNANGNCPDWFYIDQAN